MNPPCPPRSAPIESWSRTPIEERVSLLLGAASIIRERKFEFMAWLTYEVGKNWAEADADVGETIDFLEFYAREALRLAAATTPIQYPGERNELLYIPLGVGAVISPWNFPFAIMAGMTAAAIVAGNTVILKPSSDSPTIAARFVEVLEASRPSRWRGQLLPRLRRFLRQRHRRAPEDPLHRLHRLQGRRPRNSRARRTTRSPARSGSSAPSSRWAAKTRSSSARDADLDAAIDGVVASAFGFSGQKCSACSRAIVEAPLYDVFVERLRERVATLTLGDPGANPNMGPVINQAALDSMLRYIEIGKKEGKLIAGGSAPATAEGGYFIEPTIFAEIAPNAVLAQEEIFGPVLALIKVANFEEGLRVANNTEYGLTGSLYTTDPRKKDRRPQRLSRRQSLLQPQVHRRHGRRAPFGGFNMSGTDSKAGGPDYLYLFTQAKSVAEKL